METSIVTSNLITSLSAAFSLLVEGSVTWTINLPEPGGWWFGNYNSELWLHPLALLFGRSMGTTKMAEQSYSA